MLAGRPMLARLAVALALLVAPSGPRAQQQGPEALVRAMRDGDVVVFLRYAATVASQVDTGRLGDRGGQRNLSPEGRAQAEALGRAFRALGVPLGERVLASPVFRALDTAEIAFGPERVEATLDLVADDHAGAELGRMLEATARLLSTPPPEGGTRLLVGHRTPLEMVTGRPFGDDVLPEGAMAVFAPDGDGARVLGTLTAEELVAMAGKSS